MTTIDYFFSPVSPWTYMGHQRFEAMARRHGAGIAYKPVDYGRVFPASGGLPVGQRPKQRQAYRLAELERWRTFLDIRLNVQPKHFPVAADGAARVIVAAPEEARGKVAFALMRACWAEERDVSDRATRIAVANEQGLDGAGLVAAAEGEAAGREFDANTAEAIDRQVFGAPTYVIDGELFWGQDRLDFVERKLRAR